MGTASIAKVYMELLHVCWLTVHNKVRVIYLLPTGDQSGSVGFCFMLSEYVIKCLHFTILTTLKFVSGTAQAVGYFCV